MEQLTDVRTDQPTEIFQYRAANVAKNTQRRDQNQINFLINFITKSDSSKHFSSSSSNIPNSYAKLTNATARFKTDLFIPDSRQPHYQQLYHLKLLHNLAALFQSQTGKQGLDSNFCRCSLGAKRRVQSVQTQDL